MALKIMLNEVTALNKILLVRQISTTQVLEFKKRRIAPKAISKFTEMPTFPHLDTDRNVEIEPAKLHMLKRVKSLEFLCRRERVFLKKVGLHDHRQLSVVVKNTPEMNKILWQIKHLISVHPVIFPQGIPDLDRIEKGELGCLLSETGEFLVSEEHAPHPSSLIVDEDLERRRMKGSTLKERLHKNFYRW